MKIKMSITDQGVQLGLIISGDDVIVGFIKSEQLASRIKEFSFISLLAEGQDGNIFKLKKMKMDNFMLLLDMLEIAELTDVEFRVEPTD